MSVVAASIEWRTVLDTVAQELNGAIADFGMKNGRHDTHSSPCLCIKSFLAL